MEKFLASSMASVEVDQLFMLLAFSGRTLTHQSQRMATSMRASSISVELSTALIALLYYKNWRRSVYPTIFCSSYMIFYVTIWYMSLTMVIYLPRYSSGLVYHKETNSLLFCFPCLLLIWQKILFSVSVSAYSMQTI